jgi:hypothetical protein
MKRAEMRESVVWKGKAFRRQSLSTTSALEREESIILVALEILIERRCSRVRDYLPFSTMLHSVFYTTETNHKRTLLRGTETK